MAPKTSCGRWPSPLVTTCASSRRLDEPNGATQVFDDAARRDRSQITFLDAPLLSSLLFQNTRTGRVLPSNFSLSVWEDLPPEAG